MKNRKTVCPICCKPLQEGDSLSAEWYAECEWFVLRHRRNGKDWCAVANHETVRNATAMIRALSETSEEEEF